MENKKISSIGLQANQLKSQQTLNALTSSPRSYTGCRSNIAPQQHTMTVTMRHTHALYYRQKSTASARSVAAEPRRARGFDLTFLLVAAIQPRSPTNVVTALQFLRLVRLSTSKWEHREIIIAHHSSSSSLEWFSKRAVALRLSLKRGTAAHRICRSWFDEAKDVYVCEHRRIQVEDTGNW